MNAPCFCPGCGLNFEADEDIELDGYRFLFREQIVLDGDRMLNLTAQQFLFLHTLAKAKGRWVRTEVIANRIAASESEGPANLVNVVAHRVRRKIGPERSPVSSANAGRLGFCGYRWAKPGSAETAIKTGRGRNYFTEARSAQTTPEQLLSLIRP